jgi:hypothetical protein
VFDLRAHAGLAVLALLGRYFDAPLGHLRDFARPRRDAPLQVLALNMRLRTLVAGVTPHLLLLAVQQLRNLLDIGLVGRRGGARVHQATRGINRDVRLHAEVPLVALLGLVHLGVALALLVFGPAGHDDDGRIVGAALAKRKALALEVLVDRLEDVLGQVIGFEQVAKAELMRTRPCSGASRRVLR